MPCNREKKEDGLITLDLGAHSPHLCVCEAGKFAATLPLSNATSFSVAEEPPPLRLCEECPDGAACRATDPAGILSTINLIELRVKLRKKSENIQPQVVAISFNFVVPPLRFFSTGLQVQT